MTNFMTVINWIFAFLADVWTFIYSNWLLSLFFALAVFAFIVELVISARSQ